MATKVQKQVLNVKTSIKCENFMHRLVCRHWQTKLFLCEDMDIQREIH